MTPTFDEVTKGIKTAKTPLELAYWYSNFPLSELKRLGDGSKIQDCVNGLSDYRKGLLKRKEKLDYELNEGGKALEDLREDYVDRQLLESENSRVNVLIDKLQRINASRASISQ